VFVMKKRLRDRISWAAALAATAGLATAVCVATVCVATGVASATPSASGAPTASLASGLTGAAVPVLAWKPCDNGFQCATARVPLNYKDPRGAQLSIAVISHRATGPGSSLSWLFFNGGGPNPQVDSLVQAYDNGGLPAPWRERYNIITFDPRGMGYSTQLRCFPTEAAENKLLGGLPVFPGGRGAGRRL